MHTIYDTDPPDPLVVVVANGRYDVFAQHVPPTERDRWLFSTIYVWGGVNENVAPGTYHYNHDTSGSEEVAVTFTQVS